MSYRRFKQMVASYALNTRSPKEPSIIYLSDSREAGIVDLLAPLQAKLCGYIFALVPHTEDAHDLYQQTVMALWQKFDQTGGLALPILGKRRSRSSTH